MTREARLKKRYAGLYHCLQPGVWLPAAAVVDRLLAWQLEHPDAAGPFRPGRLLLEDHFEFRGASPRETVCSSRDGEW
jgi:hypothetical protein